MYIPKLLIGNLPSVHTLDGTSRRVLDWALNMCCQAYQGTGRFVSLVVVLSVPLKLSSLKVQSSVLDSLYDFIIQIKHLEVKS